MGCNHLHYQTLLQVHKWLTRFELVLLIWQTSTLTNCVIATFVRTSDRIWTYIFSSNYDYNIRSLARLQMHLAENERLEHPSGYPQWFSRPRPYQLVVILHSTPTWNWTRTNCVSDSYANQLHHRCISFRATTWSRTKFLGFSVPSIPTIGYSGIVDRRGSDPLTLACKTSVFPTELTAQIFSSTFGSRTRVSALKGQRTNHYSNVP